MSTYDETIDFLYSRINSGIKLGLENTTVLLEFAGNPHSQIPFVHVAGTNGKGSVCVMLASALQRAGLRVGLFTSPHLVSLRERLRVDGEPISEAEVIDIVDTLRRQAAPLLLPDSEHAPTFFEFFAAIGFEFFRRRAVDVAVIEVGMGGRLDATNVITPRLSVITEIDFDHTGALGETIAEIAGEKAGIIKQGVPVIASTRKAEAVDVIEQRAADCQSTLYRMGADFRALSSSLDNDRQVNRVSWHDAEMELTTQLLGAHQADNAATAWAALNVLAEAGDLQIDLLQAGDGIARAIWPARFQMMRDNILIDAAHNPGSLAVYLHTVRQIYGASPRPVLFGAASDKPWQEMLAMLRPVSSELLAVTIDSHRAADGARIAEFVRSQWPEWPVTLCDSGAEGLAALRRTGGGTVIGSLYLAGEVLAQYTNGQPVTITS
jgi:dihydrofolate synthase/folylpolyglutamate synthase